MSEDTRKLEELKALQSQLSTTISQMESGEANVGSVVWEHDLETSPIAWYITYATSKLD